SPLDDEDFAEHASEWMEPVSIPYGSGRATSFPPPTQGVTALAMLALCERFDMATLAEADYVHVLVEAAKLAFVDRDRHLTDASWMSLTPSELLDPPRLAALSQQISMARALPTDIAPMSSGDTIAIVTADRDGNAVSLIQSLYFTWGSGLMGGD